MIESGEIQKVSKHFKCTKIVSTRLERLVHEWNKKTYNDVHHTLEMDKFKELCKYVKACSEWTFADRLKTNFFMKFVQICLRKYIRI